MAWLPMDYQNEPASVTECFMHSILRGDTLAIEALIDKRLVNIDELYKDGVTPLGLAVTSGDPNMVACLLHYNANPNLSCPEYKDGGWCLSSKSVCRMYPLDFALRTEKCEIVECLIDGGAFPVHNRGGLKAVASFAVRHHSKKLLNAVSKALEDGDNDQDRMVWCEALAIAIAQRDQAFVSILLEKGANPNMLYEHLLPLTRAADVGDRIICRTLLNAGAYLDQNHMAMSLGQSVAPLSCAIQAGLFNAIMILIELGCSVDTSMDWSVPSGSNGRSLASGSALLHIAVWKRKLNIAKALVDAGCYLNPQNSDLMTPLHLAVQDPHAVELLKFLLSLVISSDVKDIPIMPNTSVNHCSNASHVRCQATNGGFMRIFSFDGVNTSTGPGSGLSVGNDASTSDAAGQTDVICSQGFNRNFNRACSLDSSRDGKNSQHKNCTFACSPFCPASRATPMDRYNALPTHEVAINARDKFGRTALILAVEHKNIEAVNMLLEHKADVEVKDSQNWTVLHYAAKGGDDSLVLTLLHAGCTVDVAVKQQLTALQVAVMEDDTTITEILLEAGADVKIYAQGKMTLLHLAVKNGCYDVASVLLERSFIVDVKTSKRATPLMLSARVDGLKGLQLCQLLTRHGAVMNAVDNLQGESALLIATYYGNKDTAIWLIKEGANIQQRDKRKKTPIYWAVYNSRLSTLVYMIYVSTQTTVAHFIKTYSPNTLLRKKIDFLYWFTDWCATPRTLKDCCRQQIRRSLIKYACHRGISRLLPSLPLPEKLRLYLIYESGCDGVPCFRGDSPASADSWDSEPEELWD